MANFTGVKSLIYEMKNSLLMKRSLKLYSKIFNPCRSVANDYAKHMKTLCTIVLAFIFLGFNANSQDTESRSLDHFTGIVVKNGVQVQLVKSDKEKAEIKVQEIETVNVITEISGGVLTIRYQAPILSKPKVMVKLYYNKLLGISASGQSEISSTSLMKQESLEVDLVSGAKAYLDLDVNFLKSRVSEGAVISADGYAVKQEAFATTGATLSLFDLESDEITVKVTANGKAKLYAEKSLTAEASTGGYISYKGNPEVKTFSTSIGGKIEKYAE